MTIPIYNESEAVEEMKGRGGGEMANDDKEDAEGKGN